MRNRMSAYANQVLYSPEQAYRGGYLSLANPYNSQSQPLLERSGANSSYSVDSKRRALQKQITKLAQKLEEKETKRREQKLLGNMLGLASLAAKQLALKQKTAEPPPEPDRMLELMQKMQERQDYTLQMLQQIEQAPRTPAPKTHTYYAPQKPTYYPPSESTYPIEERYNRIKDDPTAVKLLFNGLGLPEDEEFPGQDIKYDPNLSETEKMNIINNIKKQKKQAAHQKHLTMAKNKYRGGRHFKVLGIALWALQLYIQKILRAKEARKQDLKEEMEHTLTVYAEVTKSWCMKVLRVPLTSLSNDTKMDLNIFKLNPPRENVLKLQVRVKAILEGLTAHTNSEELPREFRSFLDKISSSGAYFAEGFFLGFEASRLHFDESGALAHPSAQQKQLIIAVYLITKIIISEILLKPKEFGIPVSKNSHVEQ